VVNESTGKSNKYGDNVDTDVIIPARYLNTSDPNELAKHCMEDIDTEFVSKVQKGDIMVAGKTSDAALPESMPLLPSRRREYPALLPKPLQEFSTEMQ